MFKLSLCHVDKFLAAQRVEHLTVPRCGRGQGSNPGEGNLVICVNFFGFLLIFLSLLIIGF